jgi:hypothetical protein
MNTDGSPGANSSLILLGAFVIFGLGMWLQWKGNQKARRLIGEWAHEHTYELLSCRWSYTGGKFWFRRSKSQRVYRVTIRDNAGLTRNADVRCGSWFSGMLSDDLDVRWRD